MYWECADRPPQTVKPMVYLVALAMNKRTYLLPIPNLYEDGRVCLGRENINWAALGGIMPQMNRATEILQQTSWNTDLLRDCSKQTQAIFRFDPDGKQLPVEGTWIDHCRIINLSPYEFLAKTI
jgi:hypothetical protein